MNNSTMAISGGHQAAIVFCVLFTVLAIVQFIVIGVLYARLRGIKVEHEIQLYMTAVRNWINKRITEFRETRQSNHVSRQPQEQPQPAQHHLIPFPGIQSDGTVDTNADNNITESLDNYSVAEIVQNETPRHSMAELMKAGLKELEQKRNNQSSQRQSTVAIDNKPIVTEIVFATYDMADDVGKTNSTPCEYEQPIPLKSCSKTPKNVILASYEVARKTDTDDIEKNRAQSFSDYSVIDESRHNIVPWSTTKKHKEI